MNRKITEREVEILQLCAKGLSNPEIAEKLLISVHTVKAHMSNILEKLNVTSRSSAAVIAFKEGLIK